MKRLLLFFTLASIYIGCNSGGEQGKSVLSMSEISAIADTCSNPVDSTYTRPAYDIIVNVKDTLVDSSLHVKDSLVGYEKKRSFWDWLTGKKAVWIPIYESVEYWVYDTVYGSHEETVTIPAKDTTVLVCGDIPIPPPIESDTIEYGMKYQDLTKEETVEMLKKMNLKWFRPSNVALLYWNSTDKLPYEYFYSNGVNLIVNIGWHQVQNNVIRPFVTASELTTFKQKLKTFLDLYAKYIKVVCIENEPTNDGYFGTAPISDYIAELRAATEVCSQYTGLLVTDGATHIGYINTIRTNGGKVPPANTRGISEKERANIQQVFDILTAEKNMEGLSFSNFHDHAGSSYPANIMVDNVAFMRTFTGKDVISNEMSFELSTEASIKEVIKQSKDANLKIFVIWSGDGWNGDTVGTGNSKGDAFTIGTTITKLGWYLINAISLN